MAGGDYWVQTLPGDGLRTGDPACERTEVVSKMAYCNARNEQRRPPHARRREV